MTNFSIVLYLTEENLSSFSNTLGSILNQENRFMDMTVISEIPNASFDIRTLNTKVIKSSDNVDLSAIFQKCIGSYILYIENQYSEVVLDRDFCDSLLENKDYLSGKNIISLSTNSNMLLLNKDYAIGHPEEFRSFPQSNYSNLQK